MILTFSVSNFRSFDTEETLSLVASKRLGDKHASHLINVPDSEERALKTAVIYGANGAGKSNLFRAMQTFKRLAILARKKEQGLRRNPNAVNPSADKETEFDLQFVADGHVYRYGITCTDDTVVSEWFAKVIGGRQQTLFTRQVSSETGEVEVTLSRSLKASDKLRALKKVGGPRNQSFLATCRANLSLQDLGEHLESVIGWFTRTLKLIEPDVQFAPVGHMLAENKDFLKLSGAFLKDASTGVSNLVVAKEQISEEELKRALPRGIAEEVIKEASELDDSQSPIIVSNSEGEEFLVGGGVKPQFHRIAIESEHGTGKGKFKLPIKEESDGTQRLLNLLPTLHRMSESSHVFFIDEIDRSLHPALMRKFLEVFLKSCSGRDFQLVLTTHEAHLLDQDLLRRDEIWFAEKDASNISHLHSLNDYKVRDDVQIRKHYLQGRFGAIPFLGNLDHLLQGE